MPKARTQHIFTLTVKADNAAFREEDGRDTEDARGHEIARILRDVAKHVAEGGDAGVCMDINGNSCGAWSLS